MSGSAADVTPVILTRDEEANIGRTLAQLAWAREVMRIWPGRARSHSCAANVVTVPIAA